MNVRVMLVWVWIVIAACALFYSNNSAACYIALAISQIWVATNMIIEAINGKS